jgi:superfamily II DNA or RNA helicase
MTTRTREWLRGFLALGARAEQDGIPTADVERQEDTVLRALDMLGDRPGIVLADEVGMGKTYEALGIAACLREERPRSRIVVVTPGPDLNTKWFAEFSRFREMYDFGENFVAVSHLSEFVKAVRHHPVVVAPVTMFQSGRSSGAQSYLLSLYFHWKGLHGHTANAIMERFRDGEQERVDVHTAKFLDIFSLDDVAPHLRHAFCRGSAGGAAGLDDLYEKGGLSAFENSDPVRNALYRARFVLTGRLMPMIDLLIVDEAHKLKNPGSLRTRAMQEVFSRRFRKALFLTATPFQLDVSELKEIFTLFARAKGAPDDLLEQVEGLLADVAEYQRNYEEFQRTWSSLDPVVAVRFCEAYDHDPAAAKQLDDPTIAVIAQQIESLRGIKEKSIEPGFRRWMIRSLREDKRTYRRHLPKDIRAAGVEVLPFLIYERFIAELFRRHRQTHKAAVEINMVSSYAAAHQGTILASPDGIPIEAEAYRELLRGILGEMNSGAQDHPKLRDSISDALDAANRGEKTLIFCSRLATLEQLRRELDSIWECRVLERWRKVYPGAHADEIFDTREDDDTRQRGRHSQLQARFHRPQDALYLALREYHCRTVVTAEAWFIDRLPEIVGEANILLRTVRVGKTAAERIDYQVARRCVEQAAAIQWSQGHSEGKKSEALSNLCDPDYIRFGLDLKKDDYESDSLGDAQPHWEISERVARMVLGNGDSLWEALTSSLDKLCPNMRVRLVEQLARYLTYKQVPFLADLLMEALAAGLAIEPVESAALLEFMPQFWRTASGQLWMNQLRTFLVYFVQRDPQQQLEILDGPIKTGDFARHTRDGESRERLREAFNTPLYPMILIANEVMQEGLDLHKHCRRIVHHDLVWNPAQIEQRVGRIDRLGSLTNRLRKSGSDVTLDVLYPVIRGTIDERLFRTVKTREKWLEFLLGAPPNFSEYSFTEEEPTPLPDRLGTELSIDLGPK